MTADTENLHVEAILSELVQQFSDPVACFRELVQNALDAGTPEIAIDFEWREPETDDAPATMVVEVRDWGEGMDRELIEGRLTRLFSSAKDDDYTKIGRFGIGFVSVFALEPECVCVDTGRSGEYWRVLFDGRKSFELISLDQPVEGTRIRIFKHLDRSDFEQFRDRARDAVLEWCKHARTPIRFDGRDLRRPFELESTCSVSHTEEGTRLIVGISPDEAPPCGYYNRGLTLSERDESPWPHISFKIDSRYLEHTITRDQLLEDAEFQKATNLVEHQIRRELPSRLLDRLDATAEHPSAAERHDDLAAAWRDYLAHYPPPDDWRDRPIIPTVDGDPVSVETCRRAAEQGRLVASPNRLAPARFRDTYTLVDTSAHGDGVRSLLEAVLDGELVPFHREFARLEPLDLRRPAARECRDLTRQLAELIDIEIASLQFARIRDPSPLETTLGVASPSTSAWIRTDKKLTELDSARDAHVSLNCKHPSVRAALEVASSEPEWAAYTLIAAMSGGHTVGDDRSAIIETALASRRKRREAARE